MTLIPKLASIDDLLQGRCGDVAVGDVLAFNGVSAVDEFIQGATKSEISHVAVLMRGQSGGPLLVLEATEVGVSLTPLGESLEKYRAEHTCFYLPLASASRARVAPEKLAAYYHQNAFDKYNYDGVVEAGIYDLNHPLFRRFVHAFHGRSLLSRLARWWYRRLGRMSRVWAKVIARQPSTRRLFCSQLVTEVLQAVEVVEIPPQAHLVVPVEVCWFDIYAGAYQLNGQELMPDAFRWGDGPAVQPAGSGP